MTSILAVRQTVSGGIRCSWIRSLLSKTSTVLELVAEQTEHSRTSFGADVDSGRLLNEVGSVIRGGMDGVDRRSNWEVCVFNIVGGVERD